MYMKVENGVAKDYSLGQLRKDHPNVSFPQNPPESLLAEYGVYPYTVDAHPALDPLTETAELGDFELVDGKWVKTWSVKQKSSSDAGESVRQKRDMLLARSDWTQIEDATVDKDAWKIYRQGLRDVPQQSGFPYNVAWPAKPL